MQRDRFIQAIALTVMVVCLGASGVLAAFISGSLGRHRLVYADAAEKGDPPEVAFGIAAGAFRGLFVNYLWIRANNLKEEGKYYEAVDLASAITRLQPRFPKVWVFHAWNLAYNISVATQTPQERWTWVKAGINLLRDKGIPANPNDLAIHKELAWIYLHKVQGVMDDAHTYYKQQHALEWTFILSTPPNVPTDKREGKPLAQWYVDKVLTPIAEAYDTLDELYAAHPEARELVQQLKDKAGLDPDMRLLEQFEVRDAALRMRATVGFAPSLEGDPLLALMVDPRYREAGKALLNHVRRRVLIDQYKMEPERMIRYTLKYGPLDWRHPAAHAVYWSARGVEESLPRMTQENKKDYDIVNTDRETIQAIQELFRTGRVYFDILHPGFYRALPDPEFIETYGDRLGELVERSEWDSATRMYRFYSAGYENFLRDVIRYTYRTGRRDLAEKYYTRLRTWPGLNKNNIYLQQELSVALEEFVKNEIIKENRETSPSVALQEISGSLEAAYINGLLTADDKVFESNLDYALRFYHVYQETQGYKTWLAGPQGRLGFPPFDFIAAQALAAVIVQADIPEGPTMYRRAPAELRGRAYVLIESSPLRAEIEQMAKQGAPGFDIWFPPPDAAALKTYREQMTPPQLPSDAGTVEQH